MRRLSTTLRVECGARARHGVPECRGLAFVMRSRRPRADVARRAASIVSMASGNDMSRFDFRSAFSIDVAGSSPRPGSPAGAPAAARSSRDSELRSARGRGDVRPGLCRDGCGVGSDFLNAEAIDTASDYAQTQRASAVLGSFSGKRLHLVQFAGPVKPQWVDSLAADGLRVVNYIPDNAYLVWAMRRPSRSCRRAHAPQLRRCNGTAPGRASTRCIPPSGQARRT